MLRQEELAFMKAMSTAKHSPVFLRELRKSMASGKKNLSPTNAIVLSVLAIESQRAASNEAQTSCESYQLLASKGKAYKLTSLGGMTEPATHLPAPKHLVCGPGLHRRTSGAGSRELDPEFALAYTAIVSVLADPQQPRGPYKPLPKGLDDFKSAASSKEAISCISLGDMSGSVYGMPDGTILNAQMTIYSVAPAGQQSNITYKYV